VIVAKRRQTDGAGGGGGQRRSAVEALRTLDPAAAPLRLAWTDPATGSARSVRVPDGCARLVAKLVREAAEREQGK
jgi:hypothetical protein